MTYFVNRTFSGITVHQDDCHEDVEDRHGPFANKQEAVSAARALAIIAVHDCDHCGGAGGRYIGCHCQRCRRR